MFDISVSRSGPLIICNPEYAYSLNEEAIAESHSIRLTIYGLAAVVSHLRHRCRFSNWFLHKVVSDSKILVDRHISI